MGCGSTRAGGVEVLRVLVVCVCLCYAYVACSRIRGCATVALRRGRAGTYVVGMGGFREHVSQSTNASLVVVSCLSRSPRNDRPPAPAPAIKPRLEAGAGGRVDRNAAFTRNKRLPHARGVGGSMYTGTSPLSSRSEIYGASCFASSIRVRVHALKRAIIVGSSTVWCGREARVRGGLGGWRHAGPHFLWRQETSGYFTAKQGQLFAGTQCSWCPAKFTQTSSNQMSLAARRATGGSRDTGAIMIGRREQH